MRGSSCLSINMITHVIFTIPFCGCNYSSTFPLPFYAFVPNLLISSPTPIMRWNLATIRKILLPAALLICFGPIFRVYPICRMASQATPMIFRNSVRFLLEYDWISMTDSTAFSEFSKSIAVSELSNWSIITHGKAGGLSLLVLVTLGQISYSAVLIFVNTLFHASIMSQTPLSLFSKYSSAFPLPPYTLA